MSDAYITLIEDLLRIQKYRADRFARHSELSDNAHHAFSQVITAAEQAGRESALNLVRSIARADLRVRQERTFSRSRRAAVRVRDENVSTLLNMLQYGAPSVSKTTKVDENGTVRQVWSAPSSAEGAFVNGANEALGFHLKMEVQNKESNSITLLRLINERAYDLTVPFEGAIVSPGILTCESPAFFDVLTEFHQVWPYWEDGTIPDTSNLMNQAQEMDEEIANRMRTLKSFAEEIGSALSPAIELPVDMPFDRWPKDKVIALDAAYGQAEELDLRTIAKSHDLVRKMASMDHRFVEAIAEHSSNDVLRAEASNELNARKPLFPLSRSFIFDL